MARSAVTGRGLLLALVVNSAFLVFPLESAFPGRWSRVESAQDATDVWEGSAFLMLYSVASCAVGVVVAFLASRNFGHPWAKPAFLALGVLTVGLTTVGVIRHYALEATIEEMKGIEHRKVP